MKVFYKFINKLFFGKFRFRNLKQVTVRGSNCSPVYIGTYTLNHCFKVQNHP